MAASMNKTFLIGNLTRDPEVRNTTGGSAVAEISLAINRIWYDQNTNERKEAVDYIDCTLFGKTAEVAESYLRKGRSVMIEGRLQLDSWQDKQTGQNRSKLKVVGESMQMLGSRDQQLQPQSATSTSAAPVGSPDDDDIPF